MLPELIDNKNKTLKDDLSNEIKSGSKLSIAAACFSIYAFQELKDVLSEIKVKTGHDIKYALWLADEKTVFNFYGRDMAGNTLGQDYDAYEIGPIILSDLGFDGTLYGYTDFPEPVLVKKLPIDELINLAQRKSEVTTISSVNFDKER